MRASATPALPLGLLLLTAGCLGGASGGEPPGGEVPAGGAAAPSQAPDAAGPAGLRRLALAEAAPTHRAQWANGTFELAGHGTPLGLATGIAGASTQAVHRVDITQDLPPGIPTRVVAQVDAALAQGDVDLWLSVGANEWWTGDWDTPFGGTSRVEAVLVRTTQDPIEVLVAYDDAEPAPSFDYALHIEAASDPARLPVGPAYGLRAPPGTTLHLAHAHRDVPGPDRAEAEVLLFGPDDRALARVPFTAGAATLALPADGPEGEFVLAFSQGRGDVEVRVADPAGAVALRLLPATFTMGDPQEVPAGQSEVTWTFEVPRQPLLVGFWSSTGPLAGTGFRGQLASPAATLFDFDVQDGGPYLVPGLGGDSGYSPAGLVTGTYTATAGFGTHAGPEPASFVHFVIGYAR